MNHPNLLKAASLASLCVLTAVACESGARSPVSPSAVVGVSTSANADGSTLKVTAPDPLGPTDGTLAVALTPTLSVRQARGNFDAAGTFRAPILPHRFQVSDVDTFTNVVSTGTGSIDAQGLVRYNVAPALTAAKKYFWRSRAEFEDAFGPWSAVQSFTTAGAVAPPPPTTPTTPTTPGAGPLPRTPDPAAGRKLPLPDRRDILFSRFTDTRDSCPRGLKYINNPWQDRVIDAFRQTDSRWGYNAKPNRSASDNGGVPVVAAGDEAAYNRGTGADEGTTDVELVDMLVQHCGSSPSLGWRVFTGEEPGRWTGARRF